MRTVREIDVQVDWGGLPVTVDVEVQKVHKFLAVGQRFASGAVLLWALVDDESPPAVVRVWVTETGGEIPSRYAQYVGTVLGGGEGALHVWVGSPRRPEGG